MMKLNYVATLLMIYLNCLMCVYSIKCYQCRSDQQGHCADLRGDQYLIECPSKPKRNQLRLPQTESGASTEKQPYCRKISQALYFTTEYVYVTIRECAFTHEDLENCYRTPWKDSKVISCDCEKEGCNQGYSRNKEQSFLVILFCTIFSLMSWRFFLRNNHMLLRT